MKLLFILMLLAGFGFWLTKEIQHESELQTQLDETHQALDEAQKHLQSLQQQGRGSQQQATSGVSPNSQWMWGKDSGNPLNAPASGGQGRR
jgi:hypothetical protein